MSPRKIPRMPSTSSHPGNPSNKRKPDDFQKVGSFTMACRIRQIHSNCQCRFATNILCPYSTQTNPNSNPNLRPKLPCDNHERIHDCINQTCPRMFSPVLPMWYQIVLFLLSSRAQSLQRFALKSGQVLGEHPKCFK